MNVRIVDYKIIEDTYAAGVENAIRDMIKDGWQPFGSPGVLPAVRGEYPLTGNPYPTFCQAVVMYEQTEGEP